MKRQHYRVNAHIMDDLCIMDVVDVNENEDEITDSDSSTIIYPDREFIITPIKPTKQLLTFISCLMRNMSHSQP